MSYDKEVLPEKRDIHLVWKFFVDTGNFLKHRRVLLRSFLLLWDKKSPTGKIDNNRVGVKFIDTGKNLKHRNLPLRKFSILRDWKFQRKIVITSAHIQKFFRLQKFSELQNVSSTTFFATAWQKKSDEKPNIHLLCRMFLDGRIFLIHRRAIY